MDETPVLSELPAGSVAATLPARPLKSLTLRHTVGLADPLFSIDLADAVPIADGFPQKLEEYLRDNGVRYLKMKVSGNGDADLDRLAAVWRVAAANGETFSITLDGKKQYASIGEFAELMEAIRARPELQEIYESILFIEQPVERTASFDGPLDAKAMATIGKPPLIDEADGWTTAFCEAIDCGYRGVSHKNCKGCSGRSSTTPLLCDATRTPGRTVISFPPRTSATFRWFLCNPIWRPSQVSVSLMSNETGITLSEVSTICRRASNRRQASRKVFIATKTAALRSISEAVRSTCRGSTSRASASAGPPDMDRLIPPADWNCGMLRKKLDA